MLVGRVEGEGGVGELLVVSLAGEDALEGSGLEVVEMCGSVGV